MAYVRVMTNELHPFEARGLGRGPFRLRYVASIPSPSLAEHNVDAYNNALRSLPRDCPLGVCEYCGMLIMHNFVCEDADGKKFAVGSECVHKAGDKALGDAVAIEHAKIIREQRRAARAAKRERDRKAYLEANKDRLEAEALKAAAERKEREEAQQAERRAITDRWSFVIPALQAKGSDFCKSIIDSINKGFEPRGRAVQIVGDIYAASHGRRNSDAYEGAERRYYNLIEKEVK